MKSLVAVLCLLTAALPAAPVKSNNLPDEAVAAFKTGTKFVLFSLEPPITRDPEKPQLKPEEGHHGFAIFGSTELADAPSRASAVAAITDAVRGFDGLLALCFEPRHSLRVIAANGTTYDFVTCFECHQVYVYRGKKRIGTAGMTGSQKRLDDLLVAAKIPLAKPASSK